MRLARFLFLSCLVALLPLASNAVNPVFKGHDFSRAVTSQELSPASAAEGCFFCRDYLPERLLAFGLAQTTATTSAPPQPQSDQAYHLPPDKLAKARTLDRIRITLGIAGALWGLAVLWLLLRLRIAAAVEQWSERRSRRRWIQGLLFFASFFVITTLAALPLDLAGHIASLHFGISVQSWAGWFGDQGKGLALEVVLGSLVLLLFNWIVKVSPRRFWLWCWVIAVPLMLAGTFSSPIFERIFDKFEPLTQHHAALVADLEKVVARTGTHIPPDRMYLMFAARKTNGLNAYVSGLGATKHIVVWDTTAGRIPDDQIMFIFGHETGHYVLNHIVKGLVLSAIALFLVFFVCARFAAWLVRRNGAQWGIAGQPGIAPLPHDSQPADVLKGHGFSRAVDDPRMSGALAAEGRQSQPGIAPLPHDPQRANVLKGQGFSPAVNAGSESAALAAEEHIPPLATRTGFVVLLFTLSIAGFVAAPASNTVSRYFEHQADVYGQEAIHGLVPDPQRTAVAAFNSLGEAYLEDPIPNPFIEFWLYDHPSTKNRANFAAHYDPWANGGHGEFFSH